MVGNHYALLEYNDKEMDKHNNSYFIEEKVLSYIEKGNVDALTNYSVTSEINAGTIADSTLRQMKNTCVVITTLASRAAIRGGLSTDIAFHLSDSYILQAEAMSNAEDINTLLNQILLDYTKRTANCQNLLSTDPVIRKVFQFVKHNTNRHITVDDVAEYVGFSRGYLSSMFNTRLGFKLSDFIRRCKLEEAKELLRFTDKSLSEISSYLCFSSQSHFQNLFKKQYGITPLQYRSQSVNLP